jgi:hypothetical protein
MNASVARARWLSQRAATLVLLAALGVGAPAQAETAAIATRVFNGYQRTRLPDGSVKPETYAFADGGCLGSVPGDSIARLPFRDVATMIGAPMVQRGYLPAKDPRKTDLLIFVCWGTLSGTGQQVDGAVARTLQEGMRQMLDTRHTLEFDARRQGVNVAAAANGQGAVFDTPDLAATASQLEGYFALAATEQRARERQEVQHGLVLGFQDDLLRAYSLSGTQWSRDLLDELHVDRYYVVLKAYDFQLAWKEKRQKILWEARFSIARPGTDFAKALPAMAQQASRYFGQDSKGLVRDTLPEVKIEYGETRVIRVEPGK